MIPVSIHAADHMTTLNSFDTVATLTSGGETFDYYSLPALERAGFPGVGRLPYSLKILLENLLRREDGRFVKSDDVRALASWDMTAPRQKEIAFMPARVLLQDFTGVPCVVDLAAMRDGIAALGGDPRRSIRCSRSSSSSTTPCRSITSVPPTRCS